ncbi:MAG: hypothetical protein M1829_000111 [Trizodia sp. TS-e1964]|nr:MAG: hypothetical protein M1829_000111 [Trizodia sp. TS-e1964]
MDNFHKLDIFGGGQPWNSLDWEAVDDRVRGGSSQSYLDCNLEKTLAIFYGNLDTKTLGGAGFASQSTTGRDRRWDLSAYDGILLDIAVADNKRYTFILKDTLLPKHPDTGREQAGVSYEYDFLVPTPGDSTISFQQFIPWSSFTPTFRGRERKDAPPIDTSRVKRMSLMMRSFFDAQEGPFSLTIRSISAVSTPSPERQAAEQGHPTVPRHQITEAPPNLNEKGASAGTGSPGLISRFLDALTSCALM